MATSVKFLLNRPKSEKPTSILVRFHSRQTKSITLSTGEMIPPRNWSGQRVTSRQKGYDRINKHLSDIESKLFDLWRDHKSASGAELAGLVAAVVKGISAEKKTLLEAFRKFIDQYSREKEPATLTKYRSLYGKIESFNPDLTFEDLTQTFYDEFKNWLYDNDNQVYAGFHLEYSPDDDVYLMCPDDRDKPSGGQCVGLFDDIVHKYLVLLKTVCGWAEKRGYQVNPSYKEWKILKHDYPIISLTLEELQRIEALTDLPIHLHTARDYFSICCRSGQRISDVKRISALTISTGSWTIFQKKGSRQKQKIVQLPLVGFCEPVKDIIQKYGGQLPKLSEQHLNRHIKTLCLRAGITQEIYIERWAGNKRVRIPGKKYEFISTHSGKKTFITILASEGTPLSVISDFTGTTQKTIEKHYLGRAPLYVAEKYLKKIESPETIKKAI